MQSSVDLIISSLGLHWTNDLPGSMIQVFPFLLLFLVYVNWFVLGAILMMCWFWIVITAVQTSAEAWWPIFSSNSWRRNLKVCPVFHFESRLNIKYLCHMLFLIILYKLKFFVRELRIACTLAHMEREGGISPRLSPLAQVCVWILASSLNFLSSLKIAEIANCTWQNQNVDL